MKKILILVILFIVILVIYNRALTTPVGQEARLVVFNIESGEGVDTILTNLEKEGLLGGKFFFKIYVWQTGAQAKFQAGSHKLSPDMTAKQILEALTTGKTVNNDKQVTIIEGWRADEMGQYLEGEYLVTKDDFMAAIETSRWQDKYGFLKDIKATTIEGFLFPDTYRFFTDTTADEIIVKMLDNFDSKFTLEMRQEMVAGGRSLYEIITLASIVEGEASSLSLEDKKIVADVFYKRIRDGIALQSDATVNYVTGKSMLRPTLEDLEIDSPYNTYKYAGLTPGPISNPGLDSIMATVYPTANTYYYFLTDKDENIHYAKTYNDHLNNIRLYLNN